MSSTRGKVLTSVEGPASPRNGSGSEVGRNKGPLRTVVSVQDVSRPKPAPDVFLLAAERLGVTPAACVVIEDSAAGVQAARDAGMGVIAITNSLPAARLAHAHHIVSSYDEIAAHLLPAVPASPLPAIPR